MLSLISFFRKLSSSSSHFLFIILNHPLRSSNFPIIIFFPIFCRFVFGLTLISFKTSFIFSYSVQGIFCFHILLRFRIIFLKIVEYFARSVVLPIFFLLLASELRTFFLGIAMFAAWIIR